MKNIHCKDITECVKNLCIKANCILNDDVYAAISKASEYEESEIGKDILKKIMENARIAHSEMKPICQDTGMAVIFIELGQDVHIQGGFIKDAVNDGVRLGYKEGYLRKSIVFDPLIRKNTNDNTPALIHYDIVEGENIKITVAPKGFGSENMSRIFMLKPSDGRDGVINAVMESVINAGSNPCPPMVIGVGIGSDFEGCALLSKKALLRPIGTFSDKEHLKSIEKELFNKINSLGIGPQGLGGRFTVLGVNVVCAPTHIAGMPVAVNISCHVTRHAEEIL